MKILLTGVTGYIAQRLLPVLLENGHEVVCCVRDKNRFNSKKCLQANLSIIEVDFLSQESLQAIPNDIDVAYYLIHSMSAKSGGLKRTIIIVPVMTPKISSYWLYFVTATSFALAKNLVNSMKVEVTCKPNNLEELLGIKCIDYDSSIKLAFDKIEQNQVLSSWKDAQTSKIFSKGFTKFIEVPINGCFKDSRSISLKNSDSSLDKIWAIGGKTGWYYGTWLWEI